VSKTLLAVDDSVTMRKVLEITFSGEDFNVLGAESSQAALSMLAQNPDVCVIDTTLGTEDGYALAKEVRKRAPGAAIILLSSRYNPFDQARGRDAGADDFADKPFDTQQLIDKVHKAVSARSAGGAPAAAPAPAAAAPQPPPAPRAQPAAPAPAPARPQPSAAAAAASAARTGTLVFGDSPAPAPVAARPAAVARPGASATATHVSAGVSAGVNGHLAGKLGELGLSADQANAVLELSREVVERVVWEVVPQVAEALIKEEIARLMRE
jgi:DNA-binding response OmpR family regulator